MSDTRSTASHHPRRRSHRHRKRAPEPEDDQSDSDYSTPTSDEPHHSRQSGGAARDSRQQRKPHDALVVREQYHVRGPPRGPALHSDDEDDEGYTVGGDGDGRPRQRYYGEKEGDGRRFGSGDRGLVLVIAAFVVGLVFCLRETRTYERRREGMR